MDEVAQRLLDVIREPFDGDDVVTALASPTVLENLHMIFDPLVAEEFVSEMGADSSFRQERIGVEGFLAAWRDWAAPWESLHLAVEEVVEFEDGLYTEVEQVGVPKDSSVEVRQRAGAIWALADGKLTRVEFHLDVETARRSAGLSG